VYVCFWESGCQSPVLQINSSVSWTCAGNVLVVGVVLQHDCDGLEFDVIANDRSAA